MTSALLMPEKLQGNKLQPDIPYKHKAEMLNKNIDKLNSTDNKKMCKKIYYQNK